MEVENTDWHEVSKYIAMNLTPKEINDFGLSRVAAVTRCGDYKV